jgi:hypothetical protein
LNLKIKINSNFIEHERKREELIKASALNIVEYEIANVEKFSSQITLAKDNISEIDAHKDFNKYITELRFNKVRETCSI